MPSPQQTLLRAKWIAPIDRPILQDAAIVFDNKIILSIGDAKKLSHDYPRAEQIDLPNSLLLPGLINAHTHLELSLCQCGESPASFIDWILSMRSRLGDSPDFAAAALTGAAQSLRFGITCVGDISQQSHLTRPELRNTPLRIVSYGEALGIGVNRQKFDTLLDRALDRSSESARLKIGISPHAPYSVEAPNYRKALAVAQQQHLPLATHLAEQPYESEWLRNRTGPFREALETMGFWQPDIDLNPNPPEKPGPSGLRGPLHHASTPNSPPPSSTVPSNLTPISYAHSLGLLDFPTLLAHCNYCTDSDLQLLATSRASVIYCPRTHQYFNHPPHRWRDMLSAGINVALGTDSCASSPDLNLLDDLRLLRQLAADASAESLWKLITTNAARALTLQDQIGSLTPNKFADLIAFEIDTNNPLEELLHDDRLPTHTWIAGTPVEK